MKLCVYLSDIDHVENIQQVMHIVDSPPNEKNIMPLLGLNNKTNIESLLILDSYYNEIEGGFFADISRIYFGNETCETLIPTVKEVERALDVCDKFDFEFTLVTPYVSPKGIKKLLPILEYLHQYEDMEVVFNDFGVLHILNTQYPHLVPVMGRLLNKMKRDPRFTYDDYPTQSSDELNVKSVKENQTSVLRTSSFEIKSYQKLMAKKGVNRISMDTIPQGMGPLDKPWKNITSWNFPIDIYWPWTYITSGRNCQSASLTQKKYYVYHNEEPCQKQCKKFDYAIQSDIDMYDAVHRGNAVWINAIDDHESYFKQSFDRLVFEPYIPI